MIRSTLYISNSLNEFKCITSVLYSTPSDHGLKHLLEGWWVCLKESNVLLTRRFHTLLLQIVIKLLSVSWVLKTKYKHSPGCTMSRSLENMDKGPTVKSTVEIIFLKSLVLYSNTQESVGPHHVTSISTSFS